MRIGIIGTGEMGSGIGGMLAANGGDVTTTLAGRSAASAARINATTMKVAPDLATLARSTDIVLSIVPPDQAIGVAEAFCEAAGGHAPAPIFVDCNAIAPATVEHIAKIFRAAKIRFVDAGIIGGAPKGDYSPKLYASGADVAEFEKLSAHKLHVVPMPGDVGVASSMKMCYAGISKGFTGISAAMFAAAEHHGIADVLKAEFAESQPALSAWVTKQIPTMYPKAYRWVGEMREIATFGANEPGVPTIYEGLAQEYEAIADVMRTKGGS
jgi:3-hydroxyisobutyrate dehydrogenase-like beta-hydroxyacid dehydrogenase